jgi:hypothetical protein
MYTNTNHRADSYIYIYIWILHACILQRALLQDPCSILLLRDEFEQIVKSSWNKTQVLLYVCVHVYTINESECQDLLCLQTHTCMYAQCEPAHAEDGHDSNKMCTIGIFVHIYTTYIISTGL